MKIINLYVFLQKAKKSGSKETHLNPLLPEFFVFKGFFNREKIKVRNHLYQRLRTFVVREAGLEFAQAK